MKTTLCIIDMQPDFSDAAEPIIENVVKQAKLAKKRGAPIVIVEFEDCGTTYLPIRKAIGKYDKLSRIKKKDQGGGVEVSRIMRRRDYGNRIKAVGVNTDMCVQDTVCELLSLGYKVSVSDSGCHTHSPRKYHRIAMNKMKRCGARLIK